MVLEHKLIERVDGDASRVDFIRSCFTPPLDAYQRGRFRQNNVNNVLGAIAVLAGLAASAVATAGGADSPKGRIAVAVLGVAASGAAGIVQLVRPGRRAIAYRRAAMELDREGWYFVLGHPPYHEDPTRNWERFVSRVMEERELAERVHDPDIGADRTSHPDGPKREP